MVMDDNPNEEWFCGRCVGPLILETKGHDPLEEVKAQAAQRWVEAVNGDGRHGTWRYAVVHEMASVPAVLSGLANGA